MVKIFALGRTSIHLTKMDFKKNGGKYGR